MRWRGVLVTFGFYIRLKTRDRSLEYITSSLKISIRQVAGSGDNGLEEPMTLSVISSSQK